MSDPITLQPDAVAALGAELSGLAGELAEDAALCGSTAASLRTALGGAEGAQAGDAGSGWARLTGVLAARAEAVGVILGAAVDAYRAADARLYSCIGPERHGSPRHPR